MNPVASDWREGPVEVLEMCVECLFDMEHDISPATINAK